MYNCSIGKAPEYIVDLLEIPPAKKVYVCLNYQTDTTKFPSTNEKLSAIVALVTLDFNSETNCQ